MTGVLLYNRRIPDLSHLHYQISKPLLDPDVANFDPLPDPDVADSEPLSNYFDVTVVNIAAVVAAVVTFVTILPVVTVIIVIKILKYYLELILFKN
ncbi:hypothetical protein RCL_jg12936.t1 [Rhizophagus clarus]|uniref:Uncharacterized protein n=1 Tax=Rhizophagus clarus TaxID=94130 RepID=A0A8H3R2U5_9GLOM|nr:hypothetical protein RCL_jg12936.t1 [Rhizophagus clarus]